jgi:hypothetical protein
MIDAERLREWQRKVELEDRRYRDQQRKEDLDRLERESQYRAGQDRAASWRFWTQMTITVILAAIALVAGWLQKK